MVNHFENVSKQLLSLNVRDWKSITVFLYFILFQIAFLIQLPFIQIDFVLHFYIASLILFGHHLLIYKLALRENLFSTILDISVFIVLAGLHPVLVSFNLIVILFLLFIAGLQLNRLENMIILATSSILFSAMNLLFFKWEGLQNLFSLVLFNFSFIVVNFLSQYNKTEIINLQNEINLVTEKLRSQEEFSHILMQEMPSGLTALNKSGQLLYKNDSLSRYLNLEESDIKNLQNLIQDRKSSEIYYFNTKLNQKKIYDINSVEYFDHFLKTQVQLLLIKDVTEVKNLQDEIKQKEKLAAIGQLAAGIAHEIRNPLAGISGSIQLLSNETKNDDDLKLMRIINKEIDRLNNLITEFLEYSKPEKRPDQKIDISFIMNEVLQNIKASKNLPSQLQIHAQIQTAFIYGFSDKLKQVFLNIAMNAIQAMSDQYQPELWVSIKNDLDTVIVSIKDNGSGMSEETKKRIFEPFYTTKSKGTGLGLAITHKVLDSHSARIQIETELGKGTDFIITFNKA